MRKKFILVGLIIILLIAGWIFHLFTESRPGLANIQADVSINADELYNQFQADEAAANKKYLDKVIEVKGTVTDIEQTDSTLSIELKGTDIGGVNCGITDVTNKKLSFQKGSTISIKGRCSGFLMDVNMVDCVIEK